MARRADQPVREAREKAKKRKDPTILIPFDLEKGDAPLRVVAFDLGSNMAVAHNLYGDEDIRVQSQSFDGLRWQRAALTLAWLKELFAGVFSLGGCDVVIYERPFARGQDATRSLWGVAGLIEAAAAAHGYVIRDADPQSIKQHSTGSGIASKDDMLVFANLCGYVGDNEHEADAFSLLQYARAHVKYQPPKLWQKKILKERHPAE